MRPTWAATWARFTATVVFPVPPFPLAMAIFMEAESILSSLLSFPAGLFGSGDFVEPASHLIECGRGRLCLRGAFGARLPPAPLLEAQSAQQPRRPSPSLPVASQSGP